MQKHTNKKKKTDTRTGKTAAKKKNSRSKRRKSSRVRQRNQRILMSLMLLVIIVLIGWIIINRASENGWSIGDFLHNSDTMISDAEQSGTDNADFFRRTGTMAERRGAVHRCGTADTE